jgi:hypothetical protein
MSFTVKVAILFVGTWKFRDKLLRNVIVESQVEQGIDKLQEAVRA